MKSTNFLLLIFTIGMLFGSCKKEDKVGEVEPQIVKEDNSYLIAPEDAVKEAALFLSKKVISGNATKRKFSAETSESTVKTTEYTIDLSGSDKNRLNAVKKDCQNIPLYTIDFKDETGRTATVITVGDKRFSSKIIAYNDENKMDLGEGSGEAVEFFEDMIKGYIHNTVNSVESDPEASISKIKAWTPPYIHGAYLYGISLRTTWHQKGNPYTNYTPYIGQVNAAAGCNAVAMGQLMVHHRWPTKGAYLRYGSSKIITSYPDASWRNINTPTPGTNNEHVANLLAEIAFRLNSRYGIEYSDALPPSIKNVFYWMGYDCNYSELYDVNRIATEIKTNKRPLLMYGYKATGGGHMFLITQVAMEADMNDKETNNVAHFYINNGAGNNHSRESGSNGWFCPELFSTQISSIKDTDIPSTYFFYPYRHRCGIITGIVPNNRDGSTTPTQVSKWF